MRKHHAALAPQFTLPKLTDPQVITQVREYEVITPIFGGGVVAGENDLITPIRGSAIRAQLRFWWRACRGGDPAFEQSLTKMKQAEASIWGSATLLDKQKGLKHEDTIQIQVEVLQKGHAEKPFSLIEVKNNWVVQPKEQVAPSYAAFPLRPLEADVKKLNIVTQRNEILKRNGMLKPLDEKREKEAQIKINSVLQQVRFNLIITFPVQQKTDVEAALWAWETFGGVGARTRRGFGALKCVSITENGVSQVVEAPLAQRQEVSNWLVKNVGKHVVNDGVWPEHVPHLNRLLSERETFRLIFINYNAQRVWESLIERLKKFRQQRSASAPGRSAWPEPDVIRVLLKQKPLTPIGRRKIFPRASFGLPIVFHFTPENTNETTLHMSKTEERMASPLILRPLVCQNNQYFGLAFILLGYEIPQETVILQEMVKERGQQSKVKHEGTAQITKEEAQAIPPLKGQTNVLKAFLDYL